MRRLLLALVLLLVAAAWAREEPPAAIRAAFDAGRYAEAVATLQRALADQPNRADLHYWLGRCFYELRDWKAAVAELERAVRLNAASADYHHWLGRAYGRQAESSHSFWLAIKSRREFEEAVRLDPRNIQARRDLAEFYSEAPWIVGGSKKKARAEIDAITALDPVEGALAEGEFARHNRDLTRATSEYRRVLEMPAARPDAYFEAAEFFANHGDLEDLQRALEAAARVAPTDPRLSFFRGVADVVAGSNLQEAEVELKAYLARVPDRSDFPSHAEARAWLGLAYEKQGRRLEAAEQYRAALRLDADLDRARQGLQRLEKNH
jgi:tetratricopeptide (TPR) repeat protein